MYPWISRTLDFGLQFCEKKCGLYMDVYGNLEIVLDQVMHVCVCVVWGRGSGGCVLKRGEKVASSRAPK